MTSASPNIQNQANSHRSPEQWAKDLIGGNLRSSIDVSKQLAHATRDSQIFYGKLAGIAIRDPILSASIMIAEVTHPDHQGEMSKTLEIAMSMIGLEQIETLAKRANGELLDPSLPADKGMLRCLHRSLFNAELARTIAGARFPKQAEEFYWLGLMGNFPEWCLWQHASEQMLALSQVRSNEIARKSTEIFGCPIKEIALYICKRTGMPTSVVDMYAEQKALTQREWVSLARTKREDGRLVNQLSSTELKLKVQEFHFALQLAHRLSISVSRDWHSSNSDRWHRILANYLHVPLEKAYQMTHTVAVETSRQNILPAVDSIAARLFAAKGEFVSPLVAPRSSKEAGTQKLAFKPTKLFTSHAQQMHNAPNSYPNLASVMHDAVKCANEGMGFSRAAVLLLSKDKEKLKTYFFEADEPCEAFEHYACAVNEHSLFAKLCATAATIRSSKLNPKALGKAICPSFSGFTQNREFFIHSVEVNGKPIALFYVDAPEHCELNDKHFKYFKYLNKGLEKVLAFQSERKKILNKA